MLLVVFRFTLLALKRAKRLVFDVPIVGVGSSTGVMMVGVLVDVLVDVAVAVEVDVLVEVAVAVEVDVLVELEVPVELDVEVVVLVQAVKTFSSATTASQSRSRRLPVVWRLKQLASSCLILNAVARKSFVFTLNVPETCVDSAAHSRVYRTAPLQTKTAPLSFAALRIATRALQSAISFPVNTPGCTIMCRIRGVQETGELGA